MTATLIQDFCARIRRFLRPTRVDSGSDLLAYTPAYFLTASQQDPPLTPQQVEDAVRLFDNHDYLTGTTSWFLPRAPDIVTPRFVFWSEPANAEIWLDPTEWIAITDPQTGEIEWLSIIQMHTLIISKTFSKIIFLDFKASTVILRGRIMQ